MDESNGKKHHVSPARAAGWFDRKVLDRIGIDGKTPRALELPLEIDSMSLDGSADEVGRLEAAACSGLVDMDILPTNLKHIRINPEWPHSEAIGALARAGVRFGKPFEGDELFCPATLPDGWTKEFDGRVVVLKDHRGRERAEIMYEPLPYKRDAWILTNHFFRPAWDEFGNWNDPGEKFFWDEDSGVTRTPSWLKGHVLGKVVDGNGDAVYERRYDFDSGEEFDAIGTRPYGDAKRWLDGNYPEWRDSSAYWD